jgi:hypothetical protein
MPEEFIVAGQKPMQAEVDRLRRELADVVVQIGALKRAHRSATRRTIAAALVTAVFGGWAVSAAGPGRRVRAPFQVVDSSGKQAFIVSSAERGFIVGSPRAESFSRATATETAAFFKVCNADCTVNAVMGVDGTTPMFKLRTGGEANDRLVMAAPNGSPYLTLFGSDGHGRVRLAEGTDGGGELLIAKPGGQAMVRAGVSAQGIGRVEAFPLGNLMGSEIVGRIKQ